MGEERQSDLIMATALAKALTDVVERLDGAICERSTLEELKQLAERAEAELGEAAWASETTTAWSIGSVIVSRKSIPLTFVVEAQ
jgi:hypothetical protein